MAELYLLLVCDCGMENRYQFTGFIREVRCYNCGEWHDVNLEIEQTHGIFPKESTKQKGD